MYFRGGICRRKDSALATMKTSLRMQVIWMQTFGSNSCTSKVVRTENSNPMYLRFGICHRKDSVLATVKTLLRMQVVWITTRDPTPSLTITWGRLTGHSC
jgi:hypothetical protein